MPAHSSLSGYYSVAFLAQGLSIYGWRVGFLTYNSLISASTRSMNPATFRRTRSNGDEDEGAGGDGPAGFGVTGTGAGAGAAVAGVAGLARCARPSRGATSTFEKGGAEPALERTDAASGAALAGTTPWRCLTGRPAGLPARRRGWRKAFTASRTSASTSRRLNLPAWNLRMAQAARTAFPSAAAGTYTNLLVNPH